MSVASDIIEFLEKLLCRYFNISIHFLVSHATHGQWLDFIAAAMALFFLDTVENWKLVKFMNWGRMESWNFELGQNGKLELGLPSTFLFHHIKTWGLFPDRAKPFSL